MLITTNTAASVRKTAKQLADNTQTNTGRTLPATGNLATTALVAAVIFTNRNS